MADEGCVLDYWCEGNTKFPKLSLKVKVVAGLRTPLSVTSVEGVFSTAEAAKNKRTRSVKAGVRPPTVPQEVLRHSGASRWE